MSEDAHWQVFRNRMLAYIGRHEELWERHAEFIDVASEYFLAANYKSQKTDEPVQYPDFDAIRGWLTTGGTSKTRYVS